MSQTSTKVPQTRGARPNRSTLVAITAAIIGIIYGYDLGNISGALLFIPAEFHLSTFQVETVVTVVVVGSIVGVLLGGPIAIERDQVAADTLFSQLVWGEETGARIVGLIAERAVELCGVPDTFVNREA